MKKTPLECELDILRVQKDALDKRRGKTLVEVPFGDGDFTIQDAPSMAPYVAPEPLPPLRRLWAFFKGGRA